MDTTLYKAWLFGQRLSDASVVEYVRILSRADKMADQQGWDLAKLDTLQTRWLAAQFPASTRKGLRSSLLHYWRMHDYDGPIDAILYHREEDLDVYKGLSETDAIRLEAYARSVDDGLPVLIGLYLGLRRTEISLLRWEDFQGSWVLIHGKGRRKRKLPIHPALSPVLAGGSGWVFPGLHGHAHDSTIYGWINRLSVEAGVGRIKCHALRHTCLTRLYQATGDLRLVQRFAGHSTSITTERYTHVFADVLEAGVHKLAYQAA